MDVLDILLLLAAMWFAVVGYRHGFVVGILSVVLQTTANLLLLQREFRLKLGEGTPVIAPPVGAGVGIISGE